MPEAGNGAGEQEAQSRIWDHFRSSVSNAFKGPKAERAKQAFRDNIEVVGIVFTKSVEVAHQGKAAITRAVEMPSKKLVRLLNYAKTPIQATRRLVPIVAGPAEMLEAMAAETIPGRQIYNQAIVLADGVETRVNPRLLLAQFGLHNLLASLPDGMQINLPFEIPKIGQTGITIGPQTRAVNITTMIEAYNQLPADAQQHVCLRHFTPEIIRHDLFHQPEPNPGNGLTPAFGPPPTIKRPEFALPASVQP